ncbi:Uncharacterised protein [Vibrio cholerae]|nr:Uncharacterised protein [Vibrio cholerae]
MMKIELFDHRGKTLRHLAEKFTSRQIATWARRWITVVPILIEELTHHRKRGNKARRGNLVMQTLQQVNQKLDVFTLFTKQFESAVLHFIPLH